MDNIKIKVSFLGSKLAEKKPEIINGYCYVYFKDYAHFFFAKKNRYLLEQFVNAYDKKQTRQIELLGKKQFYDFLMKIPNIDGYSNFMEKQKIENIKIADAFVKNFKKWMTTDEKNKTKVLEKTRVELKEEVVTKYLKRLNANIAHSTMVKTKKPTNKKRVCVKIRHNAR